MSLKVIFVLCLSVLACEGHFDSHFNHWMRYLNGDHPEESKGTCTKASPCEAGQVCCLQNYQGHCFVNRLTIVNSDICLSSDELSGDNKGARCLADGDCGTGLWCEHARSNIWGTCVDDACSGVDNSARCGTYGTCVVTNENHGFTCECNSGYIGSDCDIPHPCEITGYDQVCGTNGYCVPTLVSGSVYPEETDAEDYFTCTCEDGWYGDRCNHENPCRSDNDPCQDVPNSATGGKCYALGGEDFGCYCELNFYGRWCNETCGSDADITVIDDTNAIITTPVDEDGYFIPDVSCEWKVVLANTSETVKITFTEFQLEDHPACKWDSVLVTQGDESSLNTDTFGDCGTHSDLVIDSTDHTMTILFKSDRLNLTGKTGFNATLSSA